MATRDPVFIVGGARSGTTFLAKLLDSHPDVLYRHEPDSVLINTEIPFLPRREELKTYLSPARHYLEALCQVRAIKVSGHRPIFDKTYRSNLQKKRFMAGLFLTKAIEKAGRPFLRKPLIIADCIDRRVSEGIVYLIKSVNSPCRTALFSDAMPTWRFIHILRHPCAVINSKLHGIKNRLMGSETYLRSLFDAGMSEGYPFTFEDLEARSYEERAAFQWMVCNQRIHDDMVGREGYRMVIYEELCQDVETSTRQLFDFAGLSWNAQSQRFIGQLKSSEVRDAGYFDIMRPPQTALDKWLSQLSSDQIERIKHMVCHTELGRHFFGAT